MEVLKVGFCLSGYLIHFSGLETGNSHCVLNPDSMANGGATRCSIQLISDYSYVHPCIILQKEQNVVVLFLIVVESDPLSWNNIRHSLFFLL